MDEPQESEPIASNTQEENEPPGTSRRTRILRRVMIAFVVLLALFYGGGGWYFSSELGSDAFAVDDPAADPADDFDLEVVAVQQDRITFRCEEGSDGDLLADGLYGVDLPDGWLHVGALLDATVDNGQDVVTRSLDFTRGGPPAPGTPADLDSWYYEADPSDLGFQYDEVVFQSPLGEFRGWFVPATADTWAILIHGKGAERREGLRLLESINAAGHPALIISYRNDPGEPADPSGYYRYGATEWAEVEGAVRYAVDHGADQVVLVGMSTGAAHALSFVYQSDLADRVAAAILDSPNIDFGRTVDYEASQRSLPLLGVKIPQSLTTVAKFIASFRFDFDWSQHDFIDDADEIDFPILVFHGTEDGTVPLDVSERLYEARPDLVTLVVVDGAEHMKSWNDDPARYAAEVDKFLRTLG
jgi:pimeloyl-ACP methyl ester carboxylesterase